MLTEAQYVCYAVSTQQLPLAEERMVIYTLLSLPGLHAQIASIIILALINTRKPVA